MENNEKLRRYSGVHTADIKPAFKWVAVRGGEGKATGGTVERGDWEQPETGIGFVYSSIHHGANGRSLGTFPAPRRYGMRPGLTQQAAATGTCACGHTVRLISKISEICTSRRLNNEQVTASF